MRPTNLTAPSRSRWLTHTAFVLALAMVVARMTTVDALRDPWDPTPGTGLTPHGPGPATAVAFDLIMMLPAVLVCACRAIDSDFRLTPRWSHLPMFLLAVWAVLSTLWSADRFAAAVTSAHLLASACLLWALSQLVRSWVRFRLVAALSFGLLMLLVAQSMMYKFVDVPENLNYWNERKAEILKQHGWEPDSFPARQFERKITSGETAGPFTSPNTLAAVAVLLFFASAAIGIQNVLNGEDPKWLALPIVAAIALIWLLVQAASKTAAATPFVGCIIIASFVAFREQVRRHSRIVYAAGVLVVVLGLLAVVSVGRMRHGLFAGHFSNSLDFRWKYWVASAGVFTEHPIVGVGWSNFGYHYLAHRLPEAAEEIKDPHNFLVRVFAELGLVGGVLLIGWLLRLAWELTRVDPERSGNLATDFADRDDDKANTIAIPAIIVTGGMLLGTIVSLDYNQTFGDTLALLIRPSLLYLALLLGTVSASMLSPQSWQLANRRAPWIFYCQVIGLGLFLLHNLIDFSWFEPGAMSVFMMLIGSALGMMPATQTRSISSMAIVVVTVAFIVVWIAAVALFAGPIIIAEESASTANDRISTASAELSRETANHYHQAADLFAAAAEAVPYNCEYPFRQAKAESAYGDFAGAESLVKHAEQLNPLYIDAYLLDANLQLQAEKKPDMNRVRSDFDTILRLNPNDVSLHVQYAQSLDRFGQRAAAAKQYELALQTNAALPKGEPRRLNDQQLLELRNHLQLDLP